MYCSLVATSPEKAIFKLAADIGHKDDDKKKTQKKLLKKIEIRAEY